MRPQSEQSQSLAPLLDGLDSDGFTAFERQRGRTIRQRCLSNVHLRPISPDQPELLMRRNEREAVALKVSLLHPRPVPCGHPVGSRFRSEEDRRKRKLLPRGQTLHCRIRDVAGNEPVGIGHRDRRSLRSQTPHAASVVTVLEAVRSERRYLDGTAGKLLRPERRSNET
jgi:hypothetical protein